MTFERNLVLCQRLDLEVCEDGTEEVQIFEKYDQKFGFEHIEFKMFTE